MNNRYKLFSLLLTLVLLLTGCGQQPIGEVQAFSPNATIGQSGQLTQQTTQQAQQTQVQSLRVAADYENIVASPWNCEDLNSRKAAMLLYDSPVKLTTTFDSQPALVTVSGSGTQWTLTVREGVLFSDGSQLTAQDVDDSLTMAMAEGSYYRNQLTNIASHSVSGSTVQVTLNTADALFANLLTFPVAKLSGGSYVGTGRYRLSTQGEDSVTLSRNTAYWGEAASIEQIELVSLEKKDVAVYSLKLGNIDCLYIEGASSDIANLSASSYPVVSNQLLFLGANPNRTATANAAVRQAISKALDRSYLIETSLSTSAQPSNLPVHPDFSLLSAPSVETRDLQTAQQLLTDAGLTGEGTSLSLTLLYSTGGADRAQTANQIAAQLSEAGITVTLDGRAQEEYFAALESGSYDLYLGEILLGDDMDLSHLWTQGERYGYGVQPSQELLTAYQTAFSTGEGWDSFAQLFLQEYPLIPLAFRNGTFCFSREFSLDVLAVRSDLFYNIDSWQAEN